jgi:hypothetical protein
MGYIGLLLNAPYKIDSMVWMSRCRYALGFSVLYFFNLFMANRTRE